LSATTSPREAIEDANMTIQFKVMFPMMLGRIAAREAKPTPVGVAM